MDMYLRDEALVFVSFNSNQQAYQAGKSTEMAFHQFILWVEKALDHQETALGVFLDKEGAFNNTCYDSICDALVRHCSEYTTVRLIRAL